MGMFFFYYAILLLVLENVFLDDFCNYEEYFITRSKHKQKFTLKSKRVT